MARSRTAASSCTSSPIVPAPICSIVLTGEDWIAQHFFTGGVMPSHHLIRQYADLFEVEKEWRWSGTHYQRTALRTGSAISIPTATRSEGILRRRLRQRHERCGCGAGAGSSSPHRGTVSAYADGSEWGVSHYRMKAAHRQLSCPTTGGARARPD